jgi:uncharacterized protein YpmS
MKNKWKGIFLVYVVVQLIAISIFLVWIIRPVEKKQVTDMPNREGIAIELQTTKEDVNEMIKHYLEKENISSPVQFDVYLTDKVELYGSLPVFSEEIQFKMTFEPMALENGDLLLKQESVSVGNLNLPVSFILKLIQKSYHLPTWVSIDSKEEEIYVSMRELNIRDDLAIYAQTFDLKNNDISFLLQIQP